MEFTEFERRGWALRSGTYDSGFGAMTAALHPRLLDAVGAAAGTRLLEVGCGTGRLAALAHGRGAEVTATDAVPEMVAEAAVALPGVRVREAALPGLPFPDGGFDAAVGAFVVNHVPDPPAAVADLHRVLAAGGRVALSCWDAPARNRAQGIFFDAVAETGAAGPGDLPSSSPFAPYATAEGLAGLLTAAGFTEVEVEPVTWTHRVDPQRWWQDVLSGTVLTSSLIESRPPAVVERIRAAYHRLAAAHPDGLPVAALLASGTRP
ncbi:class I SAM-dependent methyltransferase [Kitasatospora terrestris]|uniref:Methyltransferase type 11 domain-containing protein n=1 Tax=Kitasatospora terrestris TaxID=258051 RepID=A0ABP9E3U6_9ACTN